MLIDNNDIVILILSTRHQEYQKFKDAIRDTWAKDVQQKGIKYFFYEGGEDQNSIDGDTLRLNAPDDILGVSKKLVKALQFIFDKYPQTKIIYRTNLSSFIDVNTFLHFIEDKQLDEKTYTGYIGKEALFRERFYQFKPLYFIFKFLNFGRKINFASGSGFFIGAVNCRKILSTKVNTDLVDDIMVADAIKVSPDQSIAPLRLIVSNDTRNTLDQKTFEYLINEKHLFHYRFKTYDRDQDAVLLKQFGDQSFRTAFFTGVKYS